MAWQHLIFSPACAPVRSAAVHGFGSRQCDPVRGSGRAFPSGRVLRSKCQTNLTGMETGMTSAKSSKRPPMVVVISVLAIAAFVTVASVVQAVRQDSWARAPILAIGWLPAVLVASLWTPASAAVIGASIIAFLVELARGHNGNPYGWRGRRSERSPTS